MHDLFHTSEDHPLTLISTDGFCRYYGPVLSPTRSGLYFEHLLAHTPWKNDEVIVFGKRYVTARKTAWYGDSGAAYIYAGIKHTPLKWTHNLLELKAMVENLTNTTFNSCLLNLYHDGSEGMGWHRDNEKEIVTNSTIASLSFGAERTFKLKHIATKHTKELILQNGSLLTMEGSLQQNWLHSLPKSLKVKQARINLTFRQVIAGNGY